MSKKFAKLQGEQDRLDVFLRRVGDEGDPHPPLPAPLYEVHETGQGFQFGGALAETGLFGVTDGSLLLVGEVGEQVAHDLSRIPAADALS